MNVTMRKHSSAPTLTSLFLFSRKNIRFIFWENKRYFSLFQRKFCYRPTWWLRKTFCLAFKNALTLKDRSKSMKVMHGWIFELFWVILRFSNLSFFKRFSWQLTLFLLRLRDLHDNRAEYAGEGPRPPTGSSPGLDGGSLGQKPLGSRF